MGWKASVIIVNNPTPVNNEQLLQELGFSNLLKIKDEVFDSVVNPNSYKVYIGPYKNNLLICVADLPTDFFENRESPLKQTLANSFPDSEICAIVLHSTVNLWAYCVVKNGKEIRVRAGSAEDGTFIEIGQPLEEEKELLSKSTINEEGTRTYWLERFPDEPLSEDQVGENFVFAVCARYFGEELDEADSLLFETTLAGYSFSEVKTREKPSERTVSSQNDTKPWWRFW